MKVLAIIVFVMIIVALFAIKLGWMAVVYSVMLLTLVIGAALLGLMCLSLLKFIIKGEF
jgi:hypothetical protein